MDEAGVAALQAAMREMHGVNGTWIESVTVREFFNRVLVWEGEVQVFAVVHPLTSRCYAWSRPTEGGSRKFYAVLQVAPILSPADAVRVQILADERKNQD